MRPVTFKQQNTIFAKNQKEYLPLPAHVTEDYVVISCWRLTFMERLRVLVTGRIWFSQMTFGNSLQPQLPQVESPFK